MPLTLDGTVYYTTREAAEQLDVAHGTVRDAVQRGRLAVRRLEALRRNVIAAEELERYKAEVSGRQGWATRKAPGYAPRATRAAYHRAWRQRKKAAE